MLHRCHCAVFMGVKMDLPVDVANYHVVMILSFQTDRSWQTVEKSDQGLHCLLFYLHLLDEIP